MHMDSIKNVYCSNCRRAFVRRLKPFFNFSIIPSLKFTISLIVFLVISGFALTYAQSPVDILEADRIEGGSVNGQKVQKIIGNVYLKSIEQDLEMYCDSAYQFVESSEIRAYGNIQINTENEKIWADSLVYFTDIDFSQLRGRVIIEADSTTLFGNSVDYRFSTKVAHFIDQIRMEDPEGILTANSGFYYREADSAVFRGQVQLSDSTQYIEGDSLFSNRGKKYYEMYGDIYGVDGDNNSTLKGEYLEADSTGRRLLTGNAWLKNVKRDTSETVEPDTAAREPVIVRPSLPDSASFRPDSLANKTQSDSLLPVTEDTTFTSQEPITHEVRTGETLFSIAQNYKVTVQDIKDWNNLQSNALNIGQTLVVIPPENINVITHEVQPKETLFSLSREYEVSIDQIKSWNTLTDNNLNIGQELTFYKKSDDERFLYTVKKGDSLFKIARQYNMSIEELKEINNLNSNVISVGQQLKVKSPNNTEEGAESTTTKPDNLTSLIKPVQTDTTAKPSPSASADTTHIRAKRILSVPKRTVTDTSTIVNAYEEVRIWSRNFSAISDTSRFDDSEDIFELWSNAKTWHKQVQLSGPYIKVYLKEGEIDQLQAFPKPFAVQQDTSLDRLNQIKGDTLNAYFQDGNLNQIHVYGGSHLLRFTKNEEGQSDGAIDLTAPSTRIFFEDGELVELKSAGTIDGSYLPQSEQTAKRQLDGFIWTPNLRPEKPTREMNPRFEPIPESRPFELPRRYVNYIKE